MITAGPTREAIDPVRYISNHSTGKMGFAIARALMNAGCEVNLVCGPVSIPTPEVSRIVPVVTAEEMNDSCLALFPKMDIAILSAAVADYKCREVSTEKIKKKSDDLSIELTRNPDIAFNLGKIKKKNQLVVGFALETENEKEHARKKLKEKNFDLIVLNSLKTEGAGFGHDTNKISIFDKNNNHKEFGLKSKNEVAEDIVNEIIQRLG